MSLKTSCLESFRKISLRREIDHEIELKQGVKPPALVPYRMMLPKLEELQKQLKDLLNVGYIH